MDRLSDGYLVRTSESLYSVQSMANIRIRLIFDSSNTLVNRLGPSWEFIPNDGCSNRESTLAEVQFSSGSCLGMLEKCRRLAR